MHYLNPKDKLIDTFIIESDSPYYEVGHMQFRDENTISCLNFNNRSLKFYKKTIDNRYRVHIRNQIPLKYSFHSYIYLTDSTFVLIDSKNTHYECDNNGIKKEYISSVKKKYLSNNYYYLDLNTHPIIYKDSVYIATYYHSNFENFMNYFSEPSVSQYQLKDEKVVEIKSYFYKPSNILNRRGILHSYCNYQNSLYLIYPCFDTLYICDLEKQSEKKLVLDNKDFIMPSKYEYSVFFSDNSKAYDTEYQLNSFKYQGIFYNDKTGHFLLFYSTPVMEGETFQTLKLMVTDSSFKKHEYYEFTNLNFYSSDCFIMMPDKGIAMPIIQNTPYEDEKDIFYHVYNF